MKKFSILTQVSYIPPDAIFEFMKQYNADTTTEKGDLGQGTYKDENRNPCILSAVKALPVIYLLSAAVLTSR
jgi:aspartate aminotransferase